MGKRRLPANYRTSFFIQVPPTSTQTVVARDATSDMRVTKCWVRAADSKLYVVAFARNQRETASLHGEVSLHGTNCVSIDDAKNTTPLVPQERKTALEGRPGANEKADREHKGLRRRLGDPALWTAY